MSLSTGAEQPVLPFHTTAIDSGALGRTRMPSRGNRARLKPVDPQIITALADPTEVLFLDIETTGLSRHYDELTLVGYLRDGTYGVHIAGDDPGPLFENLQAAKALVTFNGTLFDLPFLKKTFGEVHLPPVHIDLRYFGRRAGLTGGQKAIEAQIGINLRDGLEDVDGAAAVLLWHRYLRGDLESLHRLIAYNRCDVLGMPAILDTVLDRLIVNPDFWFQELKYSQMGCRSVGWARVEANVLPSPVRLARRQHTFTSVFAGTEAERTQVVGIDLTGSEKRPSGWCFMEGCHTETDMVRTDDEIIARVIEADPALVSIDSPLSLPLGRTCVDDSDPNRSAGIMRECERELKRRGINVYPCLLPSMRGLTRRGIQLATRLRNLGYPVIESYPGAAQDIMGIPRKGAGERLLKEGLRDFGLTGNYIHQPVRHDELDAITSALVGQFFLAGQFEGLGVPGEEALIVPDLHASSGPFVIGISGRISAGKTTAARLIEQRGFAYTRISAVVDEVIRSRELEPNRQTRQAIGLEIHQTKGQRWLCEQALERVKKHSLIVVDGLRFLEDHAFFVEHFGSRFLHIHVVAGTRIRAKRYHREDPDGPTFKTADSQPVEADVDKLKDRAVSVLVNERTIEDLGTLLADILTQQLSERIGICQSPSS